MQLALLRVCVCARVCFFLLLNESGSDWSASIVQNMMLYVKQSAKCEKKP